VVDQQTFQCSVVCTITSATVSLLYCTPNVFCGTYRKLGLSISGCIHVQRMAFVERLLSLPQCKSYQVHMRNPEIDDDKDSISTTW
jgi:hypothetical protein